MVDLYVVPRQGTRPLRERERTRGPGNRSVGFPDMDVVEMVNVTAMLMSFVPHAIFRQLDCCLFSLGSCVPKRSTRRPTFPP